MIKQKEPMEEMAKRLFLKQRTNDDYIYRRPCWEELGISAKQIFFDAAQMAAIKDEDR